MEADVETHSVTSTLGIDLASQPKNTALCWMGWEPGRAWVAGLLKGVDQDGVTLLDDELLISAMSHPQRGLPAPSKIAIDAPLGWPVDFVRGVGDLAAWPVDVGGKRDRLERRATDHWILQTTGKRPLSVTTDRIAYAAMRAAALLAHYEATHTAQIDRTGVAGPICEAYPDPAIRQFGIWPDDASPRESYKGKARRPLRERIIARLLQAAPWLELPAEQRQACADSDDCLDALVCALVARAGERGLTLPPPAGLEHEARLEGWIHLPHPAALQNLA
jgi:Protein of unknown function (DUF429)